MRTSYAIPRCQFSDVCGDTRFVPELGQDRSQGSRPTGLLRASGQEGNRDRLYAIAVGGVDLAPSVMVRGGLLDSWGVELDRHFERIGCLYVNAAQCIHAAVKREQNPSRIDTSADVTKQPIDNCVCPKS